MDEKTKIEMAKVASKVMFTTVAGMDPETQLEAAAMLFKALVMEKVNAKYRLSFFNKTVQHMRNDIKQHLEAGVKDEPKKTRRH
jgi:hypothetical protein